MSKSCSIIGHCRNRQTGKLSLKLSQLHRDLLDIGKKNKFFNRKKANKAFFLSQTDKFLSLYGDELIFDTEDPDSEPILASFYEVMGSAMPEITFKDVRDVLAKKFGEGVYSYDEAINKMTAFNKEMQGAHTFMGTIKRQADGKYKFEITYNAIEELNALMQTIADKNFIDIITDRLQKLGIGITQGEQSSYSTLHFNRLANGLLGLIKLKEGEHLTSDLAKETGHAIIGTLGNEHSFVKRLTAIAESHPEIMAEIIGDEEWEMISQLPGELRTRELIGHVIGKYLEDAKNVENVSIGKSLKNLINRIIDYIKTKFAFTDRDYKQALYDAKYISYRVVRDFMGDNFAGTLDNALNTLETLQSESNRLQAKLAEVLKKLDLLADKAKDWGFDEAKGYRDKFSEIMTKYNEIGRQIKESRGLEAYTDTNLQNQTAKQLIVATRFIINLVKEAQTQLMIVLSDTNPLTGGVIKDNEICKIIRKNEVLFNEATNLLNQFGAIKDAYTGELDMKDSLNEIEEALRDTLAGVPTEYAAINDVKEGYGSLIHRAREKLAIRLLTKINGNLFIVLEQHVSFDGFMKIKRHPNTIINILNELLSTYNDAPLGAFARYIGAMLDSPSIINLLLAQAIEELKHEANVLALRAKDRLFDLYQMLRNYGIKSTSIFMELDDNGEYTGNIISERNWGQWEKKRKEDYKKWFDDWWEANKHLYKSVSEAYNDAIFLEAKGSFLKAWHDKNSIKLSTGETNEDGEEIKCWAPAISTDSDSGRKTLYDGEQYNKLKNSREKKDLLALDWLNEYMKLKNELDKLLPPGSTNMFGIRAPLFQGTFTNKLHGAMGGKVGAKEHIKRLGKTTINSFIILRLAENPSDTEYGGEHNTYDEDDLLYGNSLIFSKAHINALNSHNRVPIYGVKKLKEPYKVSTDLIHSTLAYASMAYNYSCLDSIIDEVEVLASQLRKLKINNDYDVSELQRDRRATPGLYSRMEDYIEQLVYNVYCPFNNRGLYRFFMKGLGLLTRFGSLYYLQWNVHSAITNALTGLNELLKEALGAEDFNMKKFFRAWGVFIGYFAIACGNNFGNWALGNWTGHKGSDIESHDFMNLFLKEFDAQNENLRNFRDYHIETTGYQFAKGYNYVNIAMFPYSITDKWMQAISYIATAMSTELVDKDGNKSSVWDAYTVENGLLTLKKAEDGTDAGWKILDKNQVRLRESLKEDIKNDTVSNTMAKAVYETDTDGNLIFDHAGNKVLKDIYVPWDNKALTLFKLTCRGINDRLHGVYNSGDGGAFLGTILGPSFATLKKYAIGLIDRRFSRSRHDTRSKKHRQGSTVTIANLAADYMFSFDKNKHITMSEEDKAYWKLCKASFNALLGFMQFSLIVASAGAFLNDALRKRGYSENQIANIRRFWGDNMIPEILRCLLYMVAPPDELDKTQGSLIIKGLLKVGILDERRNKEFDDDLWLPELSEAMLDGYVEALKFMRGMPLAPNPFTVDDDRLLTKEYFLGLAAKYTKSIPFSIKGILQYQLYRVLIEQEAYRVGAPSGLYGMFSEYKNLTANSLTSFSALYDTYELLRLISEHKTEEEIIALAEKKGEKVFYKYSRDGLEIYTKGINNGFKKGALHYVKVSPLRTGATWLYGSQSKKNQAFWRSRALGLDAPDDD